MITIAGGIGCLLLGATFGVAVMALCVTSKNADIASEKALLYKRKQELKIENNHPFD